MKPKTAAALAFAISLLIFTTANAIVVEKVDLVADWQTGGGMASIDVDVLDRVHISYLGVTYDLKYATNETGSWVTETIDSGGVVADSPAIALDLSNKVHITWCDDTNEDIKYSTNASDSWMTETVATSGLGPSIALDSMDKVHISYGTDSGLMYATNTSGAWAIEIVDSSGLWDPSIALDSMDKVLISYSTNGGLMYATNASGAWAMETVDSSGGGNPSIALDSLGRVHIGYQRDGCLMYATNASGAWVIETVKERPPGLPFSSGTAGISPSIAVDGSDNVHISSASSPYYLEHWLNYSTNATGNWVTGNMGMGCLMLLPFPTTSIALDSAGTAYIGLSTLDIEGEDVTEKVMVASNRCVPEICDNCLDNDCDGLYGWNDDPDCYSFCAGHAVASTVGPAPVYGISDLCKHLACFLLPVGAVLGLMIRRRKRQEALPPNAPATPCR